MFTNTGSESQLIEARGKLNEEFTYAPRTHTSNSRNLWKRLFAFALRKRIMESKEPQNHKSRKRMNRNSSKYIFIWRVPSHRFDRISIAETSMNVFYSF